MAEQDAKADLKVESDSDEDGNEVLEESPCGRWQKRREKVPQRDIPGIDVAYLAMDNELGVEVVWNEAQFSERKNFRAQEDKIKTVFDNLMQLEHVNLVKFHKYWTDANPEKPRVIFITEYMSSGSISNFLKRTKKSSKLLTVKSWKKWCTQILTALHYLHSCDPPIIHGNLTCNTIFIQHNGLIKIGCVAPEAIHHHVKTFRENMKNMHYTAPETTATITPAIDIYAFGICALEMAVLGFHTNGDSGTMVTQEMIEKTILSLEDVQQMDFIQLCLRQDPNQRPTARELMFHPVLFEVHPLRLLAAYALIKIRKFDITEDDVRLKEEDKQNVFAEIVHSEGRPAKVLKYNETSAVELDKLLEDVKNGTYPLTAYPLPLPRPFGGNGASSTAGGAMMHCSDSRVISPADHQYHHQQAASGAMGPSGACGDASTVSAGGGGTFAHLGGDEATAGGGDDAAQPSSTTYNETRRVTAMTAEARLHGGESNGNGSALCTLTIMLKMDDKMSRQLTADILDIDTPELLANELVHFGFISHDDRTDIMNLIASSLLKFRIEHSSSGLNNNNKSRSGSPSPPTVIMPVDR